jgi:hypothetical protein
MRQRRIQWAVPGVVFASAFAISAACGSQSPDIEPGACPSEDGPTTTTTATSAGVGGTSAAATSGNAAAATTSSGSGMPQTYDSAAADEIASRLHGCRKLPFNVLQQMLTNRGVLIPPAATTPSFTTVNATTAQNSANAQRNSYDGPDKLYPVLGAPLTADCGTTLSPGKDAASCLPLKVLFGGGLVNGNAKGCKLGTVKTKDCTNNTSCLCSPQETCFCFQDDKGVNNPTNTQITTCIDGKGSAPQGYCVAKPATAAYLFFTGKEAWGVPGLDDRTAESDEATTASDMKLMDLFIQAAPQIIANIGDPVKAPACTLNGVNKPMFDGNGNCVEESVSCLIGTAATAEHLLLCKLILQKANPTDAADLARKRNLAVAALLSAANLCE